MLLPLLLAACAPPEPGPIDGLRVLDAWIAGASLQEYVLLAGTAQGKGVLHVVGETGEYTAPVDLGGGILGLGTDFAYAQPLGDWVLELPDDEVRGEELLGTYTGSMAGVVMLAGVEARHLDNDRGVGIDQPFLGLGVGLIVGFEWMKIKLEETPEEVE